MTIPKWLTSNSPVILSSTAIVGVAATAVLAVRATPGAHRSLELLNESYVEDQKPEGPKLLEKVQATWKYYVPATVAGLTTIACIVGANKIGSRRNAALLAAYGIAETAFHEYKQEVIEQIGASKERKVTDEVAKKHIDERPVSNSQVIITGGGDQLCYDSLPGRYFNSDVETLRRAENEVNREILANMYFGLNEFYDLVGLASTAVGDELGWNIDNHIELIFTSHLADDGKPCIAVGYARLPRADYGKF